MVVAVVVVIIIVMRAGVQVDLVEEVVEVLILIPPVLKDLETKEILVVQLDMVMMVVIVIPAEVQNRPVVAVEPEQLVLLVQEALLI